MVKRLLAATLVGILLGTPAYSLDAPAGPAPASAATHPEMTFQVTTREVSVAFHVASRNGKPIADVQKSDLTVYQDGQPVSTITGFSSDDQLPLRLLLLIDSSSSMSKGFDSERAAAARFVRRVVRPDADRSTVVAFSSHSAVIAGTEASSPEAARLIEQLHSTGLTALFDSICEAAARWERPEPGPARRVLVLLSDGEDNFSRRSLGEAIAAAQASDLVIYAVTAHNPKAGGPGDRNLEMLTTSTGGRVFFLKKYEQSERVFAEIEQEMRSQYTVTFRPNGRACGFHTLAVEPNDRSLRARMRAGFFGDCS